MRHLQIIVFVLTSLILSACASSNKPQESVVRAAMPPYPFDLENCASRPSILPTEGGLNAGQVEREWKRDRASLLKVGRCLKRSQSFYERARQNLINTFR